MDWVRSCYTTKMRFVTGGPTHDVAWYFAPPGAMTFPDRHRFGSLNYSRGEFVDTGDIGEVPSVPRPWRNGSLPAPYDGQRFAGTASWFDTGCAGHADLPWSGTPSMPTACRPFPPPPCFSTPIPNYNVTEVSVDNGATWLACTHSSFDTWVSPTITLSGHDFRLTSQCGGISSGEMSLQIAPLPSGLFGFYAATSYATSYPPTWSFPTVIGNPVNWPGGVVLWRTKCDGSMRLSASQTLFVPTSLTATPTGTSLVGDSAFLWLEQFGTSQGGSIIVPSAPAGWLLLHGSTNHSWQLWWAPNLASTISWHFTGINAPDLLRWHSWTSITRGSTSIIASAFLDGQAAATVLSAGPLAFTGDKASLFAAFAQFRSAGSFVSASTYSAPSGGFAIVNQGGGVDGTGPPFNALSGCLLSRNAQAAATYTPGVTGSLSQTWSSAFVVVR